LVCPPTSIGKLYLPPYSPDLNPIEQVFATAHHRPAPRRSDLDDGRRHPLEVGNGDAGAAQGDDARQPLAGGSPCTFRGVAGMISSVPNGPGKRRTTWRF
jgi:hypothetical protein